MASEALYTSVRKLSYVLESMWRFSHGQRRRRRLPSVTERAMRRLHSPWRYNCLLARVFGSCVDGANQRGWSLGGGKAARRGTSALSLLTAAPVIFTLGPVYGDP